MLVLQVSVLDGQLFLMSFDSLMDSLLQMISIVSCILVSMVQSNIAQAGGLACLSPEGLKVRSALLKMVVLTDM